MKHHITKTVALGLLVSSLLEGCGGGGSGTPSGSSATGGGIVTGSTTQNSGGITPNFPGAGLRLMGGAVQGSSLPFGNAGSVYYATGYLGSDPPEQVTSDGLHLFVETLGGALLQFDLASGAQTTLLPAQGISGASEGVTTDGKSVFVLFGGAKITQISIATGQITQTLTPQFGSPSGITTDGTNLYYTAGSAIYQLNLTSGVQSLLAGTGLQGHTDGTLTQAQFNQPNGITTDGTNLYVTEVGNYDIRKLNVTSGQVTTLAGTGMLGLSDGVGTAASFEHPYGITCDGNNLYVADFGVGVRRIVLATLVVSTDKGVSFTLYPQSLVSSANSLFVVDQVNNQVLRFY